MEYPHQTLFLRRMSQRTAADTTVLLEACSPQCIANRADMNHFYTLEHISNLSASNVLRISFFLVTWHIGSFQSACLGYTKKQWHNFRVEFIVAYKHYKLLSVQNLFSTHAYAHTHTLTHENKIQASIQVSQNSFQSCFRINHRNLRTCLTQQLLINLGVSASFDKRLT